MVSRKNTRNFSFESFLSISLIRMPPCLNGYSLFMRRSFCAPPLRRSGPLSSLCPDGTSFNIQNPIPHKSQKTGFSLETRRAKEYQRGRGWRAERAKEVDKVPAEGIDTHLGSRDRAFESPHSDQNVLMKDAAQKTPRFCAVFSYIYRHFSIQKVRKTGFFGQRVFLRDRRHFRDAAGHFYELV